MRKRRWGLVLGLGVTLGGWGLWASGGLQRLDLYGLDLHFRYLSTISADPRIVLVDIDDHALTVVDAWPWPRRRYAELIRILNELGAQAIVLDIVFSEPSPPRIEHAGLGRHYDVDTALSEWGDRSTDMVIYDDDELARAIAKAGNVYTAMFFNISPPELDPSDVIDKALALVRAEPGISLGRFIESLRLSPSAGLPPEWEPGSLYRDILLAALLADDFSLDPISLLEKLGAGVSLDVGTIERHLTSAKRLAARKLAHQFFERQGAVTWQAFFEFVLPDRSFDVLTADRKDLLMAYRSQDAYRTIIESNPVLPTTLRGRLPHAGYPTLPVAKFVRGAKGVGFVSFERKRSGGVVREIPLVVEMDDTLLTQLGFLVAVDTLGIDRASIRYDAGWLVVGEGSQTRRLPLNQNGATLVNWQRPSTADRWQESFDHLPVARVMEIAMNRRSIAENRKRLGLAMAALVELRHAETKAEYAQYVQLVNERLRLREAAAGDPSDSGLRIEDRGLGGSSNRLVQLDGEIAMIEQDALLWLRRARGLWEKAQPQDNEERIQREQIHDLYEKFLDVAASPGGRRLDVAASPSGRRLAENQLAKRLTALNQELQTRSNRLIEELKPQVSGRICLVGYTASAVADLVATPVYSSMPGVMAHANIANMLLRNRPAIPAPAWVNLLLILFAGVTITLVTCARGPLMSFGSLGLLIAIILLAGCVSFWIATIYVASLAAAVLVCAVWASVSIYRQFTEERTRRQFQQALTQYTSAAVAAAIAEEFDTTAFAPRSAQVSCFFSDLAGFTRLSEHLGAERTKLILNRYLDAISRVLIEHNALVNKFMGDGIFAFFNAPLWPCGNHAQAACESALAAQEAIVELNCASAVTGKDEPLIMRIGLSTGEAFVGDYGSDTKLDYTCIGDTVNVGSRLEEANKVFSTRILVDRATREGAGAEMLFRALGRFAVAGRTAPVDAFELVGVAKEVEPAVQAYVERFERAVGCFQDCKWAPCLDLLTECARMQPHDPAIRRYVDEIHQRRDASAATDQTLPIVL